MKKEYLGEYSIYCSNIHRFGTDAVLLEYFSKPKKFKNACDLGCGCGIIPFLMLRDNKKLKITAIDIQEDAIELVSKAIELNKTKNITPICCDLNFLPSQLNGKFDLVTMNPPYKRKGAGKTTGNIGIDIARNEIKCDTKDICKAASRLLVPKGRFCICQRPERLCDVIFEMRNNGIEPKTLRNVINRTGKGAMLVLIMGQKGGNSGIDILPDLILKDDNGNDTQEITEIYKEIRGKI